MKQDLVAICQNQGINKVKEVIFAIPYNGLRNIIKEKYPNKKMFRCKHQPTLAQYVYDCVYEEACSDMVVAMEQASKGFTL